ncbi:MAG TPA: shikimate kinase, partial [Holophagaceae bacterium]|nr:shikimate kinase [Holophagaceae bacterium]
ADGLALPFHDLDEVIEARAGRSIASLFAEQGEPAFRGLEAALLPELLSQPAVIALGGGAWESEAVRQAVERSGFQAVWLAETPRRCWGRVAQDPQRPLAQSEEVFMARHRARLARWSALPAVLPFGRNFQELSAALLAPVD